MSRCRLALFDLDGVLVDSRDAMEEAWEAVQRDLGVTVGFAAYFREIGRPFADIMERLGLSDEAEEIERVYRATALRTAPRVPAFDGIEEALETLAIAGVKLGVVTSKARPQTYWTLSQFDVPFETVQTPESRHPGKPSPWPLLIAVNEARVDVEDAVFIGDMDVDCAAARHAGMRFLHAAWGYGARPAGAAQLQTPAEIGGLVRYDRLEAA
ncbi:HAD-IA family hydrolase [Conexibacter sp. JD483]|uniref:HAD family hydrolase n=1 Tax=unclassified Conexibacter TaxID=2627773 RepID=UPI0027190A8B|nr:MULTISPECIES: HAD-IA family hydrolase [unclassified Conexibacter]MDO8189170.1 HAD-IA family hydrolase [Conexibacter sp. CPCC 205706]MDO8201944.1 HAD-IA family hydrolase [Conexibacter sp. CPCC 205762]MDR9372386.1 HAD-IA family hydrolase [Conexibacter sp. JD483]